MRRKLLTGLLVLGFGIGAGSLLLPQRAECQYGNCPVGEACSGDWDCKTYSCNLKCVKVKKWSHMGVCVIVAQ